MSKCLQRLCQTVKLVRCLQTLNGKALPRVFWMPFRAVATDTGVDRTVWMAAETACSSC